MNLDKPGIYKITSKLDDEKVYIGSSVNLRKRKNHHISDLNTKKHKNTILLNYFNKYGIENLCFKVVEFCDEEILIEKEQYYIDLYNPYFNIRKVAESNRGLKHSEDTKNKLSIAHKGKKTSQETKDKISAANKGKTGGWNKGLKHSTDTRKKISNANKGRIVSQETKIKLSEAGKKRKHSIESIEKRRVKVLGMKMTKEQKEKLSEAKKKEVYKYDLEMNFIKKYSSITEAAEDSSISVSSVSHCTTGRIDKVKGLIFKFDLIEQAKPLL